tara:strand:+ start:168180 stop:169421 length:1242 start_codon:yes stop_codon:yes gene_type:complete
MAAADSFSWAADARLYAGAHRIRVVAADGTEFRQIPARPTSAALDGLGAALLARAPFCLGDSALPANVTCAPGQILTLTGGSAGQPKAVRRTQASWIASFTANAARFTYGPADSIAVLGQLGHSLALYGVLEALHLGLDAHVLSDLGPGAQAARMAAAEVSTLYTTPTQLRLLARGATGQPLSALRLILCGGGALDADTRRAAATLAPKAAIHEFYGAAETSFITLSDATTPAGAVGRAYPGVTLRILTDDGKPTRGIGTVWVRSPYLFDGYALGHSTETRWRDGFVTVGEMGQLDEDGNLWLKGRRSRMITIADQNVFPETVEALITAHLRCACAVLPRPDPMRGQHLVAIVDAAPDRAIADQIATQITDACRARFGPLATPKQVFFHPSLPLLPSGKIDLTALVRWLKDRP